MRRRPPDWLGVLRWATPAAVAAGLLALAAVLAGAPPRQVAPAALPPLDVSAPPPASTSRSGGLTSTPSLGSLAAALPEMAGLGPTDPAGLSDAVRDAVERLNDRIAGVGFREAAAAVRRALTDPAPDVLAAWREAFDDLKRQVAELTAAPPIPASLAAAAVEPEPLFTPEADDPPPTSRAFATGRPSRPPAVGVQVVGFLEADDDAVRPVALVEVLASEGDTPRPLVGAEVEIRFAEAVEDTAGCRADAFGRCVVEGPWIDRADAPTPVVAVEVTGLTTARGAQRETVAGHRMPPEVPLNGDQLVYFAGAAPGEESLLVGRELVAHYQHREWRRPATLLFEDPDRSFPSAPVEGDLLLGTSAESTRPLLRVNDARPADADSPLYTARLRTPESWKLGHLAADGPLGALRRLRAAALP